MSYENIFCMFLHEPVKLLCRIVKIKKKKIRQELQKRKQMKSEENVKRNIIQS